MYAKSNMQRNVYVSWRPVIYKDCISVYFSGMYQLPTFESKWGCWSMLSNWVALLFWRTPEVTIVVKTDVLNKPRCPESVDWQTQLTVCGRFLLRLPGTCRIIFTQNWNNSANVRTLGPDVRHCVVLFLLTDVLYCESLWITVSAKGPEALLAQAEGNEMSSVHFCISLWSKGHWQIVWQLHW